MGIDYSSVGGIGIEVTNEIIEKAISKGLFTEEEWEEDYSCCMDEIDLSWQTGGSAYSGEETQYILVDGDTFGEIKQNARKLTDRLNELGVSIKEDDLKVISDYHVY